MSKSYQVHSSRKSSQWQSFPKHPPSGLSCPSAGAGAPVALVAPGKLAPVNLDLRGLKTADDFLILFVLLRRQRGKASLAHFVLFSSAFAKELKAVEANAFHVYTYKEIGTFAAHTGKAGYATLQYVGEGRQTYGRGQRGSTHDSECPTPHADTETHLQKRSATYRESAECRRGAFFPSPHHERRGRQM